VSPTNLNELALREKKLVDEAERAIQQLNQLGLGEEISHDQYLAYLERLPCPSAYFNTSDELHGTQLVGHEIRLALYRLKYAKVMPTILFAINFSSRSITCFLRIPFLLTSCLRLITSLQGQDNNKWKRNCHPYFLERNFECFEWEGDSKLLGLLEDQGFFKHFEKDGTMDWFFHPESDRLAGLDDYQRIVPFNHVGFFFDISIDK